MKYVPTPNPLQNYHFLKLFEAIIINGNGFPSVCHFLSMLILFHIYKGT